MISGTHASSTHVLEAETEFAGCAGTQVFQEDVGALE